MLPSPIHNTHILPNGDTPPQQNLQSSLPVTDPITKQVLKAAERLFQSQQEESPHPATVSTKGNQCPLVEIGPDARDCIFSYLSTNDLLSVVKTCQTIRSKIPRPLLDRFGFPPLNKEDKKHFCERIITILKALQNSKVLNSKEKAYFTRLSANSLFTNPTSLYLVLDTAYKHSLMAPFLVKIRFPNNATLTQKVTCVRTYVLKNKETITELVCASKNMLCFPEELCTSLSNLQMLYLKDNPLSSLPEWIGNLSKLIVLTLSHNQISALPEWIGNLSTLQELYLDNNLLSSLPEWIGNLSDLQVLDLSNNNLSSLPESIVQLSALRTLYLNNNHLSSLPERIGNFSDLQDLSLSDNQFFSLPEWIGNLSALEQLYLDNNPLTSLPKSIKQFLRQKGIDPDKILSKQKSAKVNSAS